MKIFFYVCFGILLLVVSAAGYVIEPEITTELARKQFVDPSVQTDTLMRSIDISKFVYVLWVLYLALGMSMFNIYEKFITLVKGAIK